MWRILKFLKFGVFGAAFVAVFSLAVQLLWNALIPDLFHGPVLSYFQALGLLVLSHILFRGGPRGGHWKKEMWHRRMRDKMASMTPEEREEFIKNWGPGGFWGHGHRHGRPGGREEKPAT